MMHNPLPACDKPRQLQPNTIFLTDDFPPQLGGVSQYLYGLIRNLSSDHTQVIGLPYTSYEMFDANQKFKIKRLALPSQWSPFQKQLKFLAPLYFFSLLREKNVDITICGQAHYSTMIAAWLLKKVRGVPFGIFAHGLDLRHPQTRSYQYLFNRIICNANLIFANSYATKQIAIDIGVLEEKIHVVHPPVNLDKFKASQDITDVRKLHSLQNKKCLLTVGRLVERKGHDTVIKIMPEILKHIPSAHYLIVGTGPYESKLRSMVEQLHLNEHVTFIGYVPDEELAAYYLASDVFVMVSRELKDHGDVEGFGIVYLEANFFGKPVVAARTGGVTDAVLHHETGIVTDPENVTELTRSILQLFYDPVLSGKLGESGKKRVIEQFNGHTTAEKVLTILNQNISGKF